MSGATPKLRYSGNGSSARRNAVKTPGGAGGASRHRGRARGRIGRWGQLDRRLVKVRVSNKGPTTALRVEVGIRLAGNEIAAGPGGTPGVIPAFAPTDEPRVLIVQVDSPVWRSMLLHEVDHPPLWARWTDTRGTEYSDEVASP